MGLKFNLLSQFKNRNKKTKKVFVVGYDCGIDGFEVTEIVIAQDFNQAIQYAESSAEQLYEDMGLAPSFSEFGVNYEEFDQIKNECLLNAIGFWCRDFNEKEDMHLIEELGVVEIVGS